MKGQEKTAFGVLVAIACCHLLNDMLQSLLPAIYPSLKSAYHLDFAQIGLVTLTYQLTASLLQPAVGLYADYRPTPFSLPAGTLFTFAGILVLASAQSYPALLAGASILGMGSSVFHPESSRVARMASGGRHGLAQSFFQVGGNVGSALGPLAAAVVVLRWGQRSLAFFALLALVSTAILTRVGIWYKRHGLLRLSKNRSRSTATALSKERVQTSLAVLLVLTFSKHIYLVSLTSYYTFYLIHRFDMSVRNAQLHLFAFLAAAAAGTLAGGPLGDRFGRKYIIWFSILGVLPFSLALPYANVFWTGVLSVVIGFVLSSAFAAIVVYGQELIPGRVGMVSGLFFGFAFGVAGLGAALLGIVADKTSIEFVYRLCAYLPALGVLTALLPDLEADRRAHLVATPRA
jgi:FSR family fosmidomycin resistance protein-like MFS transporter